jgi:hypothetical protein
LHQASIAKSRPTLPARHPNDHKGEGEKKSRSTPAKMSAKKIKWAVYELSAPLTLTASACPGLSRQTPQ